MRRRWRRHLVVRFGDEEFSHGLRIPLATRLGEHGAHKEAHHVMEESIRLDDESEAAGPIDPARLCNGTAMAVCRWGSAAHGKAEEAVLAEEEAGGVVEDLALELVPVRPFGISPKGRASLFVCTDQIRIAPGRC